jgi:hypothetical protein
MDKGIYNAIINLGEYEYVGGDNDGETGSGTELNTSDRVCLISFDCSVRKLTDVFG